MALDYSALREKAKKKDKEDWEREKTSQKSLQAPKETTLINRPSSIPVTPKPTVNMREDAALSKLYDEMNGAPDEQRTQLLNEYIRQNTGTKGAQTFLQKEEWDRASAWEKEKASYQQTRAAERAAAGHIPVAAEEAALMNDDELKADLNNQFNSEEMTKRYKDRFYSMSNEERKLVAQINAFDEGYNKDGGARINAAAELKNKYNYTNDDITAMVYFYNRYANKEKAKQEDINARVAMEQHPFLESLASVPKGVAGGVMAAVGIADSAIDNKSVEKIGITDQGLDYNNEFSKLQRQAQSGRDEFTDTHDWMIGNYDVGDMLYNTAMSGLESGAAAFVPGGAAVLGVNAATAKANELAQRGLSTDKAIIGGVAAGAFETIFEKVSIGNIKALQEVDVKTFKDVAFNIAKSMGVNFAEEAATEFANIAYDTIAHGDKSEWQMKINELVTSGGISEKEAFKEVLKGSVLQVIEAGASGALMGAGFGAAGAGSSYVANRAILANAGTVAAMNEQTGAIIAEGQAAPEGSNARKLADKLAVKQEKGKNVSDYKLGLLQHENSRQGRVTEGTFAGIDNKEELERAYAEEAQKIKSEKAVSDNKIEQLYNDRTTQKKIDRLYDEYKAAEKQLEKSKGRDGMQEAFSQRLQEDIKNRAESERLKPEIKTADGSAAKLDGSGIFRTADGQNAIKTEDGKEHNIADITFGDENVQRLYDATEGMTAESANLFISEYNGETVAEYKRAFDYYYRMGRTGMSVEKIREGDNLFKGVLNEEAQAKIAEAGLKGREFRKGITDLSAARKNERFRYESKVLQAVGEKRNIEFIILDESQRDNGYQLTGTNRIVVYRNADGRLILRVAGHEAWHFIKNQAKDEAGKADVKALEDFVLDALSKNGMDIEAEIERLTVAGYESREDCVEEIVADSMFDVFTNEKFTEKLLNENRSLFEKVAKKVKEIIADIKAAISMLGNSDAEIRALKDDAESLEKINAMFDSLLEKAGESYRAENENGQKNNTAGAVKFSIKDMGFEEFDKQTLNNIKMRKGIVLNSIDDLRTHVETALNNPQEKANCYLGAISTSVKDKIENDVGQKLFENKQYSFVISYDDIQHISEHFNTVDKIVREVMRLYEIIKDYDTVKFEFGKSNTKKLIFEKSYSDYDYRSVEIVSKSKSSLDLVTFFVTKNNIKRSQSVPPATQSSLQRGSASTNSIPEIKKSVKKNFGNIDSEYLDFVKNGDTETAQRMVDEAARAAMPDTLIKNDNGELLTVYHGSPKKFTVFNHGRMNVNGNAHGRGFYFTEEKAMAEGYSKEGGQLLTGFLNITNPMSEEKVTMKKSDLIKLIKVTCLEEAQNLVDDGGYDKVSDALPDTWISNYVYTLGMSLEQAYREVADIIYANDNDVDIIAEMTNVADAETVLKNVYKVTGYDGVIYTNDRGTHEFVALTSNQFKSADPVTYDGEGNVIPLSERFKESEADFRYSKKKTTPIQAYWAETVKENHNFRNILSLLDEMQLSGGKVQLDSKGVDRIAKDIIKNTSSKYDKNKLSDELTVLFDYMANSKNADTEEIFSNVLGIAHGVLEKSEMKDTELYDQYKNVRDYLRNQHIYITPAVKKEIESQFGDYKSFRNILMGKMMHLSTTDSAAMTLDEAWQELSELAPEYFPKDMNELDMPMQLTAFFESVAPKVVNPYEHFRENIEDAAAELATEIFQKYYEVGRLETTQEKYKNLVFENMQKLERSKKDKVDQIAGWGAEKADEMTWGAIWNACKKQTKAENPALSGEALCEAAAELFQKTISKTQVYDSVFTKPDYMRRKEGFAMMATQFMSEPLTSLNMLTEAVVNAHKAKGSNQQKAARLFCTRAFACYVTSVLVNSAIKGIIQTIRDDDEENSFLEKYVANIVEGTATEPLGMIPYVKDILSIVQGYDLERADVAIFTTFADAVKTILNDDKSAYEKIAAVMKAAGQASGIPFYNVVRDTKAVLGVFQRITDGVKNGFEPTTGKGVLNELKETFGYIPGVEEQSGYEQLTDAYISGDKKHFDKVYSNLIVEKSESAIESGIKKTVKEKFLEGEYSDTQARSVLEEVLGMESNDIHWLLDEWNTPLGEGETYSKYADLVSAVESGENLESVIEEYSSHGVDNKTLASKITSEFKGKYIELYNSDIAEARKLETKLLDAYAALGKDKSEKKKDIAKWLED